MRERHAVLMVDRENDAARARVAFLRAQGLEVVWAHDGESAFHALDEARFDGLVTALQAPRIDGLGVLRRALERNPEACAVAIASEGDTESGVEAMRRGACDFQTEPVHAEKLLHVLRRGFAYQRAVARVAEMEEELDERFGLESMVGLSRAMARVSDQVRHLASTHAPVLIEGEPGTGKGLLARTIHRNSPRRDERFVWLDLSAVPQALLEAQLCGAAAGGGAEESRGCLDLADGGTLFLDRIDLAPAGVQVLLLYLLQDREFSPVGSHQARKVDVRIIAASQGSLEAETDAGRFREDLYRRLSPVRIVIPPLRERPEDIPLLAEAFVQELNREHRRKVLGITRGAMEKLVSHSWPGNARELRDTLESMVVLTKEKRSLDLSDLPPALRGPVAASTGLQMAVGMTLEETERRLIDATLRSTGRDKPRTAAMLGIGLRTLYRKIQRYGLG